MIILAPGIKTIYKNETTGNRKNDDKQILQRNGTQGEGKP